MRDDLELAVVEALDNILSIAFTEMGSCGAGLTKKEARACQEGFTQYMDWQGLMVEREIHPLTIEEGTAEIDHHCHEGCGDHRSPRTPMGLQESPARDASEHEGKCLVGTQIPVIVTGILSLWFQKCHLLMGGRRKGLMTPSLIRGFSSPS